MSVCALHSIAALLLVTTGTITTTCFGAFVGMCGRVPYKAMIPHLSWHRQLAACFCHFTLQHWVQVMSSLSGTAHSYMTGPHHKTIGLACAVMAEKQHMTMFFTSSLSPTQYNPSPSPPTPSPPLPPHHPHPSHHHPIHQWCLSCWALPAESASRTDSSVHPRQPLLLLPLSTSALEGRLLGPPCLVLLSLLLLLQRDSKGLHSEGGKCTV